MNGINTGKGYITRWALMGIWSVSALTSLPGLAISPISEKLSTIFPSATELDIQLLSTLPSLFIIPFILLAGFLSNKVAYTKLLYIGLSIFLLSGALYFVCDTMGQMIIVSVLLGVGAGIIIPLSTSLVSMFFSGKQRTRQFGYVSAITNIALVVATAVAGWLADIQWRLPFLVYLVSLLSLLLVPAIKRGEKTVSMSREQTVESAYPIDYRSLLKYMLYYLLITYLVMVVSINLPFQLGKLGYDSGISGMVVSVFFVAMMLPGLFINRIIAVLGRNILLWALLLISLGLADVYFNDSLAFIIIGSVAIGFGYGMAQPYIYDVTASLAPPAKVTYALALLMTMNYVAILVSPFGVEAVGDITGHKGYLLPFLVNSFIAFVALLSLLLRRWLRN